MTSQEKEINEKLAHVKAEIKAVLDKHGFVSVSMVAIKKQDGHNLALCYFKSENDPVVRASIEANMAIFHVIGHVEHQEKCFSIMKGGAK